MKTLYLLCGLLFSGKDDWTAGGVLARLGRARLVRRRIRIDRRRGLPGFPAVRPGGCSTTCGILALDWVTQGSLSQSPQGNWRWTRKVKAKTVTVALSDQQAELPSTTIESLKKLIDQMRAISQQVLLNSVEGPRVEKEEYHPKCAFIFAPFGTVITIVWRYHSPGAKGDLRDQAFLKVRDISLHPSTGSQPESSLVYSL